MRARGCRRLRVIASQRRAVKLREQIPGAVVDGKGVAKPIVAPASASEGNGRHSRASGSFDVVRRVANHDRLGRAGMRALQRGLDDVRIRLRRLRIVTRRLLIHQPAAAGDFEQRPQFLPFRRTGGDEGEPAVFECHQQSSRVALWFQPRQPFLTEDLAPAARDLPAERLVLANVAHLRQQLVCAHPDAAPNAIELNGKPGLAERGDPRVRVSVVAVDERPVNIEKHGRDHSVDAGARTVPRGRPPVILRPIMRVQAA